MTPLVLPETTAYAARYAELRMRPLRVILEVETGANLVSYDPLNLDNLLARQVLEEATRGDVAVEVPDDRYLSLPVPLQALWRDEDGLPLYAATPFVPNEPALNDVVYWHKRPQEGRFSRGPKGVWSPRTEGNRYAERQIRTPVTVCDTWTAECVGNAAEVARLLETVTAVGKNRGSGHGVVRQWSVAAVEAFSLVRDGRLTRPLPEAARGLLGRLVPEGAPVPVGWTPPQWRPAQWRPGWRVGTPVHDLEAW